MELTEFTPDHCVEVLAFWENMPGVGLNESDTPDALREFLDRNPGLSVVAREGGDVVGAVLPSSVGMMDVADTCTMLRSLLITATRGLQLG